MNSFRIEELKVRDLIKSINPDVETNYEGMMNALKKVNPEIEAGGVSNTVKRIMCLQLIAHSVGESCSIIKKKSYDKEKLEKITTFQKSVEEFCKGFVNGQSIIENNESFKHSQQIASKKFLLIWDKMMKSLSINSHESLAYMQ